MRRLACLVLLMMTAAFAASAQTVPFGGSGASGGPVEVSAENMRVDQNSGQVEFTGNVVIGQGDMRLSAERVLVRYEGEDRSRIASLDAEGGVVLVRGEDAAEAGKAVYEVATGLVTLTGDVLLTQGANVMAGETVVVNLSDGTARASGRVRTVLQPEAAP